MPLFNQYELRALEFKDGAVYRTRVIRTVWFELKDQPEENRILPDNTAWYYTGESRIQSTKPEADTLQANKK